LKAKTRIEGKDFQWQSKRSENPVEVLIESAPLALGKMIALLT
jgi:hypothetical protein